MHVTFMKLCKVPDKTFIQSTSRNDFLLFALPFFPSPLIPDLTGSDLLFFQNHDIGNENSELYIIHSGSFHRIEGGKRRKEEKKEGFQTER